MERDSAYDFIQTGDSLGLFENHEGMDQYLTFLIEDEVYGVDILRVREIRAWSQITRIPNTPEYLVGVLNLRGNIVPVVDLRLRFGFAFKPYTSTTVIILLRVDDVRPRTVGIVADAVMDACHVDSDTIQPAPILGSQQDTRHISGLLEHESNMVMLLDIDHLLSVEATG
ncbi:chemotaxis protein CheW [Methylophaga lonarensis MPL]|uniref:Chemotaxis protein CheW n=1 Tax=Methylophaga lonarensis MPL TaxID=1286106 RepID=M7PS73_9GAMM|nr:chemotaxis protein CheW [Methylophaga lonarensis]EMR13254.1 chemotaxis protein CheW [Methylophaga lonarensis MPL]